MIVQIVSAGVWSALLVGAAATANPAASPPSAPPASLGQVEAPPTSTPDVEAVAAPPPVAPPRAAVEAVPTSPKPLGWISDRLTFSGYLKLGYFFVGPAADDALVGSHNGFRLTGVRVGATFKAAPEVDIVASIDGSIPKRRETDALTGNRVVELRDAYVWWMPSRYLRVRAGQFKPPFNGEFLLPDGQLPFVARSIITEGLQPPDGFPRAGLALERQVGVELSSDRLGQGVGFRYALAAVNGNGQNVLNNDNNHVAPVARVSLEFGKTVSIAANGYLNQETEGTRPERLSVNRMGAGVDVSVNVGSLSAMAVALARLTRHIGPASTGPDLLPQERALGAMGYVRYLHEPSGFEVGARFTHYEPSQLETGDGLREVTGLIGYRARFAPVRVIVQYTVREEEPPTVVINNSVDAMLQATW